MKISDIFKKIVVWRLLTIVIAIPGIYLLPLREGFTYLTNGLSIYNLFTMWSNFDGFHYLNLAKYGYGSPFTYMNYAFFPFYPYLVSRFAFIGSYLYSALFISHLSLILGLFFLYKLIRLDYSKKIADTTFLLLLTFPTAFFFGSVYTESLFLLLSVVTFYSIRKKQIFLACIFAAIASITRVTGIFLWPAILYEFWIIFGKDIKRAINPDLIWFILPPLGFITYMKFQLLKTNDALFFVHSQPLFGAGREVDRLILPYQVFFRYFKMIIFVDHTSPLFFTVILEAIAGLLFLCLIIYAIKKMRLSYSIYMIPCWLIPSLTGTFSGMPRYVLVLFPAFVLLAEIYLKLPKKYQYLYLIINVIFSILAITYFTRGYFVS